MQRLPFCLQSYLAETGVALRWNLYPEASYNSHVPYHTYHYRDGWVWRLHRLKWATGVKVCVLGDLVRRFSMEGPDRWLCLIICQSRHENSCMLLATSHEGLWTNSKEYKLDISYSFNKMPWHSFHAFWTTNIKSHFTIWILECFLNIRKFFSQKYLTVLAKN